MHGAALELVPGPRQATADEAVRQSSRALLREPQLAPVLPAGHEADRVRDLGGPRLPRAGRGAAADRARAAWRSGARSASTSCCAPGRSTGCPRLLRRPARALQPARARVRGGRGARSAPARVAADARRGHLDRPPVRDLEVLAAVRESGGTIVAVAEDAIGPAVRTLAAHGLYAEPTSAIVIAALPELLARGALARVRHGRHGANGFRAQSRSGDGTPPRPLVCARMAGSGESTGRDRSRHSPRTWASR